MLQIFLVYGHWVVIRQFDADLRDLAMDNSVFKVTPKYSILNRERGMVVQLIFPAWTVG